MAAELERAATVALEPSAMAVVETETMAAAAIGELETTAEAVEDAITDGDVSEVDITGA